MQRDQRDTCPVSPMTASRGGPVLRETPGTAPPHDCEVQHDECMLSRFPGVRDIPTYDTIRTSTSLRLQGTALIAP